MHSRCRLCSKVNIPAWSQEWWRSLPVPPRVTYVHFVSLSIHWISFHGFMSHILLVYDTTLAWSALFSYRRVVELSVTTEDVLIWFHFLHSKEIFFSLTWHRRFMERILEAGDSNPESTFAVRHPNPPFVSWKSGLKDGEALKGRGFKPLHLYCKIYLWILIFFLIREQEEGWNNETNLLNKIQNHNRLVNSTLFTRLLTSKKWDSNSRL